MQACVGGSTWVGGQGVWVVVVVLTSLCEQLTSLCDALCEPHHAPQCVLCSTTLPAPFLAVPVCAFAQ
jgi:hypothetical protein